MKKLQLPLILFSYLNPLVARGFDRTVKRASRAGIDGYLMVDLSMESGL